jgi:hypothetical protein
MIAFQRRLKKRVPFAQLHGASAIAIVSVMKNETNLL